MAPTSDLIAFEDLGRLPYGAALALQRQRQREVIAARGELNAPAGTVFLLEHDPPVITVSRRPGARAHLIASEVELQAAGVAVSETDRGGDITYHGPGQLVVYPVVDLNRFGLRIHSYMRLLEQVVIDTVGCFGINGARDECATGVWVAPPAGSPDESGAAAKICAMGVRVSRWVTLHGLALNVTTNLEHFKLIVPCGLAGRPVTSMFQQLGGAAPSMTDVKRALAEELAARLSERAVG